MPPVVRTAALLLLCGVIPCRAATITALELPALGPATLAMPLPRAADGPPPPLVVAVPDVHGADPRSRPYLERLNARGMATLEPQWGHAEPAEARARLRALLSALPALAAAAGADAGRIGVVGFGGGGRALIELEAPWPLAALYPGCIPSAAQGGGAAPRPLLLLHGSADAAEPRGTCAALVAALGPGALRHEYFGATHAWDYAPGPWRNQASLVPGPEGGGGARRLARATPEVTEDAAHRVAAFLLDALAPVPSPAVPPSPGVEAASAAGATATVR